MGIYEVMLKHARAVEHSFRNGHTDLVYRNGYRDALEDLARVVDGDRSLLASLRKVQFESNKTLES